MAIEWISPTSKKALAWSQRGFSLMQVLLTITMVGILSSLGFAKLSTFLKQKTLQGEVQSLIGIVRQTRSIGLKKNLQVGMIFDAVHKNFNIFEDANGNGTWQSGEAISSFNLGKDIALGPPARQAPTRGPDGTAVPRTGLAGNWRTGLLFGNDPMATPNIGTVYFHNQRLDGFTVCLTRTAASNQIQAFLWNGGAWRLL
jgi:type II secretory pathway pseudopilin PulG